MTTAEFARKVGSRIPPARPDTERRFREECIRNKLLIYDGKKNRCICTSCGFEFDIAPGEYSHMHGRQDRCPCCESVCICVSAGRGRNKYEEKHRVITFASDGKSLWIVSNDVLVSFEDFAKAQIYRHISEVFMLNAEEQKHWRYTVGWYSGSQYWQELRSYNPAPLPTAPYCASSYDLHIFKEGIEEIISNSDCRYLMGDDLMEQMKWDSVVSWLSLQMKYPALELLRKGGFWMLAKNRLTTGENCEKAMNIKAKSIEKALRLPKKWVKELRKAGISETMRSLELKEFQKASEKDRALIIKNWSAWTSLIRSYRSYEYTEVIETYTDIGRYLNYMTSQGMKAPEYFVDYIRNAASLGWDLSRKNILFPKDLKASHDKAAKLFVAQKNSETDKRIASRAIDLNYTTDSLIAICAKSQEDLNNESKELHHCVRTYGQRVADGRALIYFIRKREERKKPYYTLEIDPRTGVVVQCRGLRNCSMTPEVEAFRAEFEKTFKKMIKEGMKTCQTT